MPRVVIGDHVVSAAAFPLCKSSKEGLDAVVLQQILRLLKLALGGAEAEGEFWADASISSPSADPASKSANLFSHSEE